MLNAAPHLPELSRSQFIARGKKLQAPTSREAPNYKHQARTTAFGAWILEFLWSLDVVAWCFHFFVTPICGQSFSISQFAQSGLRASQRRRTCQISQWLISVQSACGTSCINSCSIFTASFSFVRPRRVESRVTCVSTTTPTLMSNALPRTTFAVLRPTPASACSSSIVRGTSPRNFSTSAAQQALMFFALLRKKPVDLMAASISANGASAKSLALRYFLNSSVVTMFTRLSVHCAERIVATSSCSGLEKVSWQGAFG